MTARNVMLLDTAKLCATLPNSSTTEGLRECTHTHDYRSRTQACSQFKGLQAKSCPSPPPLGCKCSCVWTALPLAKGATYLTNAQLIHSMRKLTLVPIRAYSGPREGRAKFSL
eukprot:6176631-Pleurochrysis_carterae.AAC.3